MPFKRNSALQNIPLSKQPFKTQPQIDNEDITWSPRYNLLVTRTNKRMALSLQEVELDGGFLILFTLYWKHVPYNSCTRLIRAFVFHFYILGFMSWIRINLSSEGLKIESPSKWNSYEGFNLDHCLGPNDQESTFMNNHSLSSLPNKETYTKHFKSWHITLFRSKTTFCGTNNILWNIPLFKMNVTIFRIIMLVAQNIVMDMNNVMQL